MFSFRLIALAAWMGLGFGGIVLVCLNDWRLGNRPVWRGAAYFCGLLAIAIAMLMPFAPRLSLWTRYGFEVLVTAGGATLVAMSVQGTQLLREPREARPFAWVVAAIIAGWGMAGALRLLVLRLFSA